MSDVIRDLEIRKNFRGQANAAAPDADGRMLKSYDVVTPVAPISQYFSDSEAIEIQPGRLCVVLDVSPLDGGRVFLDIDSRGPWVGANLVLPSAQVRYRCEVGDPSYAGAGR